MASVHLPASSKVYRAHFTDADGRRLKRSTGEADRRRAQKIADAYEAAAKRKFTVAHVQRTLRELMADATNTPVPGSTVAEFLEAWIARRRLENAPATVRHFEKSARRFRVWASTGLPDGGRTQLALVTAAHIDAFRAWRAAEVTATTVNMDVKFLRSVFQMAAKEGMLIESPLVNIGRVRQQAHLELRPFTTDEVKKLLAAADDEWRSMILFGFYTGQRLGDIARLDWRNVNLDRGELSFRMAKTGKQMLIPLAVPLVARLAAVPVLDRLGPLHPRAEEIVRTHDGLVSMLSAAFRRLMVKCGLAEYRKNRASNSEGDRRKRRAELCFHSFRHTTTSMLRDSGAPPGVAMEFIGHESRAIHRHYAHVGSDTLRAAVARLPSLS